MDFIFTKSTKKGKEDYGSIYARVRTKGINKRYALGLTVKETEWMKLRSVQYKNNMVVTSLGITYGQFANIITQVKAFMEENYTPDNAQAVIRSIKAKIINGSSLDVEECPQGILFIDYLNQYIEELSSGRRLRRGRTSKVSETYIKGLKSMRNTFLQFQTETRHKYALDEITIQFSREFSAWCLKKGKSPSSIKTRVVQIHTVMMSAFEDHLTNCDDYMKSSFIPEAEQAESIYLNTAMIQEMYIFDLSNRDAIIDAINKTDWDDKTKAREIARLHTNRIIRLQHARDIFVVGCLIGQRVSDYKRVSKDMLTTISDNQFVHLVQKKTGKEVYIPVDSRLVEILDRYDGQMPTMPLGTLDKEIKFIAEIMGWTQESGIDKGKVGSEKKGTRICDLISSHTARRSFATNAYAAGVPLASIQAVTGHAEERMLKRYLRLEAEEKALIAAKDFQGFIQQ